MSALWIISWLALFFIDVENAECSGAVQSLSPGYSSKGAWQSIKPSHTVLGLGKSLSRWYSTQNWIRSISDSSKKKTSALHLYWNLTVLQQFKMQKLKYTVALFHIHKDHFNIILCSLSKNAKGTLPEFLNRTVCWISFCNAIRPSKGSEKTKNGIYVMHFSMQVKLFLLPACVALLSTVQGFAFLNHSVGQWY